MNTSQIWYVVIDGKANGPHTEQDVREKLNSGALKYADLAFRPGLTQWIALSECKEFERRLDNEFITRTALELDVPVENVPGWVLLAKHGSFDGRNHYIQSGPYAADQIREKLKKGEISFDDHVWKNGFTQWTEIGTLDEFDRRGTKKVEAQNPPAEAAIEAPVPVAAPHLQNDATQIQMLNPEPAAAITMPAAESPAAVAPTKHEDQVSAATATKKNPARFQKFAIALAGSCLGMLVTFVGVKAFEQYMNQEKLRRGKEMVSERALPVPAPQLQVPATAPAPETQKVAINPEIENRLPKKPTVLKIVNLKTAASGPQIGFETDLVPGTVLTVTISAKPGAILKYPSFSLVKKIEVKAGQLPVLDLAAEKPPRGTYTVYAEAGSLKTQGVLPVGNFDDDFRAKMASFKKLLLKQERAEKDALDSGSKFVSDSVALFFKAPKSANSTTEVNLKWIKALKSWNKQYKEEAKIFKDVSDQRRNAFAYPDELLKVKELQGRLKDQANIYYQNMRAGRQIASEDNTLAQIKTELRTVQTGIRKIQIY